MVHSDLLVGVHLPKPSDLSGTPVTWLGTFKIGTFKTTAVLGSDPTTTAGLDDSNVVAGSLGSVTITGVNTVAPATTVKFGLLFRASLGSGPTISVPGLGSISPNGPAHGNFIYLSLP
jgi:hypothetical protein